MVIAAIAVSTGLLSLSRNTIIIVAVSLTMTVVAGGYFSFKFRRMKLDHQARQKRRQHDESNLSRQLGSINKDLDQVRSLLLSQSREFLIDAAVVEKAQKTAESE